MCCLWLSLFLFELNKSFITVIPIDIMAQLDKHNRLIGGLGDLVFRQVNGKTIVQVKLGKNGVNQTKQTKLSSSDFGTASSTTKCLSMTLRRLFLTYYDHQMFNRFRKTVYQAMLSNTEIPKGEKDLWQGEISLLDGFEFNLSSLYSDYCSLGVSFPKIRTNRSYN